MFSKDGGIKDTYPDEIGKLARALSARKGWTTKASEQRLGLVIQLESKGYISFDASVKTYGGWGIGESRLFYVPFERRGALRVFHGKAIRLVCVRSGRYTRGLMAGEIPAPKELRVKLMTRLARTEGVMFAANEVCTPYLTRYLQSLGIRGTNRSDGMTFVAAREDSSMSSTWTKILALEHVDGFNFRLHQGQLETIGSIYELPEGKLRHDVDGNEICPRSYDGERVVGLADGEFMQINKFYAEESSGPFSSMDISNGQTFLQDNGWKDGDDSSIAMKNLAGAMKKSS